MKSWSSNVGAMPFKIKPISPTNGYEGFSINLDLDTVADAPTTLSNIRDVINRSKVGKAEISVILHQTPTTMWSTENVIRVVDCIRNDTAISEKAFARRVYVALKNGHGEVALDIIRSVVPTAAKQIRVDLSAEEQEQVAQIILERARSIQQEGEWERTLK